ncbi:uncharacterized protein LOC126561117 [Anopheles maculipalpis]|uniref:uncharacterized protein LOC126561117 n=1 Tax=Anopheles maculipalpis TaxID=1496333 RepID=UPI0021591FB6|nr:uncharacterized protein LOC126561117 [Anopheles maculipalpis]
MQPVKRSWCTVICVVLMLLVGYVLSIPVQDSDKVKDKPLGGLADGGNIHEEVVVGASLYVRKKPATSLRRQEREVRHDGDVTHHGTSRSNGLGSPEKGQPYLGKHHDKVLKKWKNNDAKVEHGKKQ